MAKSINRVILLGTIGRDAETKYLASGTAVTRFSLATNRAWKDKESGEWKEETDWHDITLWGKEQLAQWLLKGTRVYVEGRLHSRSYEKNGDKRIAIEVVADDIVLCSAKQTSDVLAPNTAYLEKRAKYEAATGAKTSAAGAKQPVQDPLEI